MLPCDRYQDQLLDHLYGLLDPADAEALDAHLAGCPACTTARDQAAKLQGLFAQAAKVQFADAAFAPPGPAAADRAPAPSGARGGPPSRDGAPRPTPRATWVKWAVAASLFLAFAGLAGPAARDVFYYAVYEPRVDREYAQVERVRRERDELAELVRKAQSDANEKLAAANGKHDRLIDAWVKAEEKALAEASARPFTLDVRGPAAAVPGAPNDYAVRVLPNQGRGGPVTVEAQVVGPDGKAVFAQKFTADVGGAEKTLRLPASMWAGVKPGAELFLHVTATDPQSGAASHLAEPVRLLEPVYTTFLATDKPLYRPGETVYFRSLTLDRTRFLPPDRDLNLRFVLTDPQGRPVPGLDLTGLARPAHAQRQAGGYAEPVVGPDGKPVRGVGTGAFVLPASVPGGANLPGGVYTLTVTEVPTAAEARGGAPRRAPLATRSILVNNYTPDRLLKTLEFDARTYGPGDVVQAKLEVRNQAQPVANAQLSYTIDADRKPITPEIAPKQTDGAGAAAIRFTLPKSDDIKEAYLSVRVTVGGVVETISRPIPIASRRLTVEFFPEGGDLVLGVPNRVYFRATTAHGKPADVSGVLTDGRRTVCALKTLTDPDHPGVNQGLGAFTFTPEPGKRYAVRLDRPAGTVQLAERFAALLGAAGASPLPAYELPRAKADGVVLNVPDGVTKPGEKLKVRLWAAGKKRSVLVGAYTRGRLVAQRKATVEPGKPTELALDPGDVKAGGVTRITVFEEPADGEPGRDDLKPVAERLVFRQSGEALKLSFAAKSPEQPAGTFLPGDPVELTVTATDEAGQPKPAILWASVVNQSVVTMADDKADRLMPTHFLLGGEVRKGEELEHADFLLTDHPKAAEGLDLLLGTQGWRRFAEQNPGLFRSRYPADADRVFLAMGGNRTPVSWRAEVRRVFDEFWPRYEAAVVELTAAQKERDDLAGGRGELQARLANAEGTYQSRMTAFGAALAELHFFDKSMEERRDWLPVTIVFTFGLGLTCLVVRLLRPRGAAERKPLGVGAVGFFALGLFTVAAVLLAGLGRERWRPLAPSAPTPNNNWPYGRGGAVATTVKPAAPAAPQMRPANAAPGAVRPGVAPRGPGSPERGDWQQFAMPHAPGGPVNQAAARVQRGQPVAQQAVRGIAQRLQVELQRGQKVNVRGQDEQRAVNRILEELPQAPPLVVREYAHARPPAGPGAARADFAETLLWQPVIVLPQDGRATLKFDLSDAVAPYRVLVAGHTLDGRLGATTGVIEVRKPFALDPKLPQEIGSADKIDVPVVMTNGTAEARTASVDLRLDGLAADGTSAKFAAELPANGGARQVVRLTPTRAEGRVTVRAAADAGGLTDSIERTLTVVPDGFPHAGVKSELLERNARATVSLPPQWVPGSLKVTVSVYPNTLAELQAGLDGLMREPYGCFEQASTANYPNVLITSYLQETNQAKPDVSKRSRELMDRGYAKLTAYECPKSGSPARLGYEWFGAPDRPHEALTAYGLLQFTDMSRVYPVDPEMLARTKRFLLDSRDGKGGFKRNARALDQFGRAPDHVTNAYIVWAITESERTAAEKSDLSTELEALLAQAREGRPAKDPYFLALVANALLNRGKQADAVSVLQTIAGLQAGNGSVPGAQTSITASAGRDLLIETTALAALGWQRANRPELFTEPTRKAVRWVAAQRSGSGSFGSTQSTILALKALVEQARANRRPPESGELTVFVNGERAARQRFSTDAAGSIVVELPDGLFKPGDTEVRVETTAEQSYPVSVAWSCRTLKPAASPGCAVRLDAKLARTEVQEGDTVRLDVRVENVTAKPHGMVVAVVGLPAGLKLPEDAKQLKNLTARPADGSEPTVAAWETRGRELVLYWRGMAPNQKVAFGLDLIADVPGEYRGPAGRAYLYYDADRKHWVEPLAVHILAKQ